MTEPEGEPREETFTRAQVRSMIAAEVRKARESFADYDDLKAKAAQADKGKSQLDKIETQLAEMTKQAESNAREVLVRDVADELKITVKQAKRLTGKNREELLADGREFLEEFKPARRKSTTSKTDDGDTDGDDGDEDGSDNEGDDRETGRQRPAADRDGGRQRRERPRENLRSGAPVTRGKAEETDPLKLAEAIPRL